MDMTRCLGRDGRWRGRGARRADRRRELRLEGLEDRRLLSTIQWNRGVNDGFGVYDQLPQAVPGKANSEVARELVDRAIFAWRDVIQDFRFQGVPGNTNTYTLNITTFSHPDSGPGAALADTDVTAKDAVGKPIRADIRMDTNGASQGWYFDTVFDAGGTFRFDNAEFRTLSNPFSAKRSGFNSPNDFYSTILHEIGHAVGISGESGMRINNFLTTDPNNSTRKFFNGPTTTATFTDNSSGLHFDKNVHRADLMNAGFDASEERRLISDLDVRVLRDAYDYTVTLPSAVFFGPLHTFLVNLNFTTGELVINGDPLVKGDRIAYDTDINTNPIVTVNNMSVDLGFLSVKSIRVGPVGLGTGSPGIVSSDNDTLDLRSLPASIVVTVDAGQGNDTINVSSLSHRIDGLFVDISGGEGTDTLSVDDSSGAAKPYAITEDALGKSSPGDIFPSAFISYGSLEGLTLRGRDGGGTYEVFSTYAIPIANISTPVTLVGGPGADTFRIASTVGNPAGGNLNAIEAPVTVIGGLGFDRLELHDENNAAASTYSINDTLLTRGAARVQQSGVEGVSILGGRGNNTYNVEKTFVDTPVSITGGAGDDTFRVTPTSHRLTDIGGLLSVSGGAGRDSLSISDTASSTTSASYSLTFLNLSRNGKAHISHPGIDELIYFGNDRGNTYNVESVASDTTVELFGGAGNDTFRLAPTSKNLNDIGRSVTFIGGNGFDVVAADDRNNTASATFRIDAPLLSRNGKGVADVNGGMDELRVLAGSGSNTFDVEHTSAEVPVKLFGNSGADTFRISPTARNLNSIVGRVTVSGGAGLDAVVVNDQANTANAEYDLSSTNLTRTVPTTAQIDLLGYDNLAITAGVGANTLSLTGAVPLISAVTFDAGAGNDTLEGASSRDNTFNVTAANAGTLGVSGSASTLSFLGVENLRGNIRDDTFKFANGAKISGRIDGSAGSDTLDYSAFTTSVSVNMVAGAATGTIGIAALENVIGGSGADVLVGNSADNILIGNAGDDLLSARDGNDVLVGGDGNDQLDDISPPQPGLAEHNVLIGGRGADTLRGFGGKEELMIGGSTVHDTNLAALRSILAEWKSSAPNATRVGHLRGTIPGGLNGGVLLRAAAPNPTVVDDAIADMMTAGAGPDWFFASANDKTDRGPDDFLN